ncbi:unnamed protein product [Ascophyllum nodosum]
MSPSCASTDEETGGGVMIVFTSDPAKEAELFDAKDWITQALSSQQLIVSKHEGDPEKSHSSFLVVNATRKVMEDEAEHIKLMKENLTGALREFHVAGAADVFKGYNDVGFFTASEQALLVRSLVDAARGRDYTPQGNSQEVHSDGAVYTMLLTGIVEEVMHTHRPCNSRSRVWQNCLNGLGADVYGVNNYFGAETAIYFAWMNFYLRWLVVPGVAGLLVHAHQVLVGLDTDNHRWVPLYALLVVVWAALFQIHWKRTSAAWAWRFGTALMGLEDDAARPQFKGKERISPITGQKERYYPTRCRLMRYCESFVVTSAMLAVALVFMICSLNLQGYMLLEEGEAVNPIESWFYLPWISKFAERGGAFDSQGFYCGCIPLGLGATVVHVVMIQGWNKVYRKVATRLTERENHCTEDEYQNNLMMKRFLFEAFDSYVSLFYLAFVQFDMFKLRNELASLFTVDCIRRVATQCLVPLISQTFSWDRAAFQENAKRRLEIVASKTALGIEKTEQMKEDKYDSFDDYLEMVIQYGYTTLFASAFPLASTISLLTTFVEIKADTFKLLFLFKRPKPRRVSGIGNWQKVMDVTTVLAVTTNCMIFVVSSEQLMQWVPKWYTNPDGPNGPDDQEFREGMGRYAVGLCFGIEHILLAVVAAFWMMIPSQPRWVRQQIAHTHNLREKGYRQASNKKKL